MRQTRDEYYVGILVPLAKRSTCVRRKVGCILVDNKGRVISTGYNGVPSDMPHCIDHPCPGANDPKGDTRRCMAVHAEINAMIQCTRPDAVHTAYISCAPCFDCSKALINLGVKRVVITDIYADNRGCNLLNDCGIETVYITNG